VRHNAEVHEMIMIIMSVVTAANLDAIEMLEPFVRIYSPHNIPARMLLRSVGVRVGDDGDRVIKRFGITSEDIIDQLAFRHSQHQRPPDHWAYSPRDPEEEDCLSQAPMWASLMLRMRELESPSMLTRSD
jgi:hypothetical protein